MKPGDLVKTPDGIGEVKKIENQRTVRYGVSLDKNHFTDEPKYYFKHELKLIYSQKQTQ